MQDRGFGQFDEFGRYVEGAAWRLRQKWFGRFARVASHRPRHIGRLHVVERQRPRGFAPAVEIGFAREGDGVHAAPTRFSAWPGTDARGTASLPLPYARPSTPFAPDERKNVDARDKPGNAVGLNTFYSAVVSRSHRSRSTL